MTHLPPADFSIGDIRRQIAAEWLDIYRPRGYSMTAGLLFKDSR